MIMCAGLGWTLTATYLCPEIPPRLTFQQLVPFVPAQVVVWTHSYRSLTIPGQLFCTPLIWAETEMKLWKAWLWILMAMPMWLAQLILLIFQLEILLTAPMPVSMM